MNPVNISLKIYQSRIKSCEVAEEKIAFRTSSDKEVYSNEVSREKLCGFTLFKEKRDVIRSW